MSTPRASEIWRSRLRRDIGWLLLAKLAVLLLLWALFFSPTHRPPNDPAAVAERMLVAPARAPAPHVE